MSATEPCYQTIRCRRTPPLWQRPPLRRHDAAAIHAVCAPSRLSSGRSRWGANATQALCLLWEIKSPKGSSNRTIENNLRGALRQSKNIIIDLRRVKIDEARAISQIKDKFIKIKTIKNIIIIKKNSTVSLDFSR